MYFKRFLDIKQLLSHKSHFLLGPRATGKSSLIAHELSEIAFCLDLLHHETYRRLLENPSLLESMIATQPGTLVVIDEIQRIPALLHEVHRLIENKQLTFLLTGSSARKLKHHSVNLLAGRARMAELFPLTYHEIPEFDLEHYLQYGGLPFIHLSDDPADDLDAYINTYLHEEIRSMALVEKLPAFSRFLQFSALTSGHTLNYASIASDTGVSSTTLKSYYQILEDTFLGFSVPPWQQALKRKSVSKSRFYLFDTGVRNHLARIKELSPQTADYGQVFEQFIAMELRAYISYARNRLPLCFWRTHTGLGVDFILGDHTAIEIKTTQKVSAKHLKGLKALQEETHLQNYILVSFDPFPQKAQGITCLPWTQFLKQLWNGDFD